LTIGSNANIRDSDDSDVVAGDASYISSSSLLLLLLYGSLAPGNHATISSVVVSRYTRLDSFVVKHCTFSLDDEFGGRFRITPVLLMCIYPLTRRPTNLHIQLPRFPPPRFQRPCCRCSADSASSCHLSHYRLLLAHDSQKRVCPRGTSAIKSLSWSDETDLATVVLGRRCC